MTFTSRRAVLGGLAFAATGLASSQTLAATKDGGAAGYDVSPATDALAVIPRRTGDAMKFTIKRTLLRTVRIVTAAGGM